LNYGPQDSLGFRQNYQVKPTSRRPPPSQNPPREISNPDFTIRQSLETIPSRLWPGTRLNFPCSHRHCGRNQEFQENHLDQHPELRDDELFHDPFITKLTRLLGWKIGMRDGKGYACPFSWSGCNYKAESVSDLKQYMRWH
jgi:hypothetical protein